MKQSIKMMLAGILTVPTLALGVAALAPAADTANAQPTGIQTGRNAAKPSENVPTTFTGSGGVFTTVANILLFIVGAVAVIMLIIGGVRYTISGGDQGQVTAAKNTILYAVIGIAVAIFAYAIVNFVIDSLLPGGAAV